jgi:HPt (histidine-containing phosphotransfer) domain-containing protein
MEPADLLPDRAHVSELLESLSPEELIELYRQFAARLEEAEPLLAAGEVEAEVLERCVHDVKGTAANLALPALASAAQATLAALRDPGALATAERAALQAAIAPLRVWLVSPNLERWLAEG